MTAWDMVMDPVMVYNNHWVWDVVGAYHGIPLQNYLGWWLTVFTTYGLYMLACGRVSRPAVGRFDQLAVVSYFITTLGMVLSSLLGGAGELGLIAIFVMSPWVIAGTLKMSES
jgi:putative membrane protein